uniref:Odorant receptor n=1 Tax=Hedya nubiferana TaxID=572853 RepID=A0A223HD21_9NEOP|nr:putative odorant receptor OR42 [Hedya nubiferana]
MIATTRSSTITTRKRPTIMGTPTFQDVFKQIRANFSLMGVPEDKTKISVKFYLMAMSLTLILVEEASFFVSKMAPENFLELTGLAPCLCVGILSILKIVPVAMKRVTVFSLAERLEKLSAEILNDPMQTDVVRHDISLLQTLIKYYFVLNAVLISVYNFSTPLYILYHYIMTKEEIFNLPYAIIVPFSTERWTTWTLVYVHSIISGFICVLFFTTVDALYFILTSYVCNIFAVLSEEIKNLEKPTYDTLVKIVKKHLTALELADDLEAIFTLPNFFNVVVGSIEICALGFNLMIGDWSNVPGCMLFIFSVLFQLFVMSVFGENLIRASTEIGESVYACDWYKMNRQSKKLLLLVMTRSRVPKRLTAFKYSVICYEGFTAMISTSWSYFTILRTVYSPEEQ